MGDILGYAFIVAATIFFVYGIWAEHKYDLIADRLNEMMEEENNEVSERWEGVRQYRRTDA